MLSKRDHRQQFLFIVSYYTVPGNIIFQVHIQTKSPRIVNFYLIVSWYRYNCIYLRYIYLSFYQTDSIDAVSLSDINI